MEKEKENKNENENEVNVLDELNKGACMGMDATKYILDKVQDKSFKELLEKQYNDYKKITDKISSLYPEYSNMTGGRKQMDAIQKHPSELSQKIPNQHILVCYYET